MKFASMLRRLRNTQGGGARSAARSRSTPYTNGPFGPVAHAGSDQTVSVKTKVYFDGSDSTDPDGGNLYYSWAFGAGAKPATGRGVKPSCTYTTTGGKTVRLTVRDTDNNVASDTVDITVIELTLKGPATVTRGEEATYTATVEPAGLEPTFTWEFTDAEGDGPPISEDTGTTNTWSGQMVVSGIIEVTATVNGKSFTKEKTITVDKRSWSDTFPPLPTTNLGRGPLPENPIAYPDLGKTGISSPPVDVDIMLVEGGPNKGWMFVESIPTPTWLHHAFINPALSDTEHLFYRANAWYYGQRGYPNYMAQLKENAIIHEGVRVEVNPKTEKPYESHISWARDYLEENPINSWAESRVKYRNVNISQEVDKAVFDTEVTTAIEAKMAAVQAAANGTTEKPHPDEKHDIPRPKRPTYPDDDEDEDEE